MEKIKTFDTTESSLEVGLEVKLMLKETVKCVKVKNIRFAREILD